MPFLRYGDLWLSQKCHNVRKEGNDLLTTEREPFQELAPGAPQELQMRRRKLRSKLGRKLQERRKNRIRVAKPPVDVVEHYEREKALRERVLANAAPLASAATFAFVVLKVLLVADSNVSTALSIVKEAGVIQVVAGVLIVGLPFLATGLVNAAGIMARASDLNRFEKRRLWSYYFGGSFVLSFVVSWTLMLLLAGFPVIAWILGRKNRKKQAASQSTPWAKVLASRPDDAVLKQLIERARPIDSELQYISSQAVPDQERQSALNGEMACILSAYDDRLAKIHAAGGGRLDVLAVSLMLTTLTPLLNFSLTSTPWLAAEKLTLTSNETVVAYVVSTRDDWATLLVEKPRLVKNIPISEIKQRETCVVSEESNARVTLWKLPSGDLPKYPKCS